ncbi:MAG: succinate dehydrogenase, cytochrome b556 subunit [Hyphomonadaceae bacterium]|nr:succinate dehydrogenase, cytochrome b556 subunit [Hyphomonadaceae bacterium]
MSSGDWTDPRPMSPHLQVWKPHLTMAASITQRITGVALYFGTFLITAWVFALAMPAKADGAPAECYTVIESIISSVFGQILLVLWAAAVLFHLANGIRHLLWDGPHLGFEPKTASAWSAFNYIFAIVGAAAIWFAAAYI